jgi:hypothetical protein
MLDHKPHGPTSAAFEHERSELQALLASGLFSRAPNLEHLLTYVCGKYFEGQSENVKEYNIAVEALGRPPDFDQKRDSIVRVEAHRLRRRLSEYYAGDGANHAVHILVPQGQYAPKFVFQTSLEASPVLEPGPAVVASPVAVPDPHISTLILEPPRPGRRWQTWIVLAVALAATAFSAYALYSARNRKAAIVPKMESPATPPGSDEVRILAGLADGSYVDSLGRTWLGDSYFHGGTVFHVTTHRILGALDPLIYHSRRQGSFGYDIPLKPGVYELRLHFAEMLYGYMNLAGGGETSRVFHISANGKPLLREFDVIADAGPSTADIKVFKDISPAEDGKLHLSFEEMTNEPFLNAIEILPAIRGRTKPILIVARDRGYIDKQGRYWEPDHYSRGGQLVVRTEEITGAADPELYRGERYGNLTYSIPVAPGRYSVTLRFAEAWFGPGKPAGGGVGSRVFDILCNGVALVRNFDIYKEAGGAERPVTRTFHGLEANHQGKLILSLVPVTNYACINAIEITDESK